MKIYFIIVIVLLSCLACMPTLQKKQGVRYFRNVNLLTLQGENEIKSALHYPYVTMQLDTNKKLMTVTYAYNDAKQNVAVYRKEGDYWYNTYTQKVTANSQYKYQHHIYIDTKQHQIIDIDYNVNDDKSDSLFVSIAIFQKNTASNAIEKRSYHLTLTIPEINPKNILNNYVYYIKRSEYYTYLVYTYKGNTILSEETQIRPNLGEKEQNATFFEVNKLDNPDSLNYFTWVGMQAYQFTCISN
jgi:hypothetical protein